MIFEGILGMILLSFHGPNGQHIEINPEEVVSIRTPRHDEGHFAKGIHCLIFTSDGKFTGVTEDCNEVSDRLAGVK